jgi:hypothetical protein
MAVYLDVDPFLLLVFWLRVGCQQNADMMPIACALTLYSAWAAIQASANKVVCINR